MKQNINILLEVVKTGLQRLEDSKVFIEYSNNMQDLYKILKSTIPKKDLKY